MVELPRLLKAQFPRGALLVFNDTRVRPWRLDGKRPDGRPVEALLLEPHPQEGTSAAGSAESHWHALLRPGRRIRPEMVLRFEAGGDILLARAEQRFADGSWRLGFPCSEEHLRARLEKHGRLPLPPYIRRPGLFAAAASAARELERSDRERYQTVYAEQAGALAAPTAGLHFSATTLHDLDRSGIERTMITLHVGLGTFKPLPEDHHDQEQLHAERLTVGPSAAAIVARYHEEKRPILAVGTTVVRALESWAQEVYPRPWLEARSTLFLKPGRRFRLVDGLLTNFHQPQSSLRLLLAAFHGAGPSLMAYQQALDAAYRFYSYGDCMLILPRDRPSVPLPS